MNRPECPDYVPKDFWDIWPWCAIDGCPNKCCLRLGSKYCWPHTPGVSPDEVAESLFEEEKEVT